MSVSLLAVLILLVTGYLSLALALLHCLFLFNLVRFCAVKYFARRHARDYSQEADMVALQTMQAR